MAIGKLYMSSDEQFVMEVEYTLQSHSKENWWGELIPMEYRRISDGSGYILELEDLRQGSCHLKKRVNRAVSGVPPRYLYHFAGISPLE